MRHYIFYMVLAAIVFVGAVFEPTSSDVLKFDRQRIVSGEWWRLFSAHFVHLSVMHAVGNVLGIAMCAYIAGPYLNNLRGFILLMWCVAFVGLGLFYFVEYLQLYVGLSGVLHGLLLVAPFVSHFYSSKVASLFALLITAKIIWEQSPWYDDMAVFSVIGGRVEANAHLLGYIAGLLFLLALTVCRFLVKDNNNDEEPLANS